MIPGELFLRLHKSVILKGLNRVVFWRRFSPYVQILKELLGRDVANAEGALVIVVNVIILNGLL